MDAAALLHSRCSLPAPGAASVSVATDDVILYERRRSPLMVLGSEAPFLSELDKVWAAHGIVGKNSKKPFLTFAALMRIMLASPPPNMT